VRQSSLHPFPWNGHERTASGPGRTSLILLWCLAATVAMGGVHRAEAQDIDPALWGVDNRVFALARLGDTLYVGGAFQRAGRSSGGAVALSKLGTDRSRRFPQVTGYVYSIAADGHGGWFLAGNFTAVGGVPRYSLAHVLADGTVAPWNPNPNAQAGGLMVVGDTVFVDGLFATISGKSRLYIAALDATTGEALDWDAHSNGITYPLAVRGNILYTGGSYTQIGGQPRNNIAAIDMSTGEATPWNPNADGGVWRLLLRDSTLYVAGSFAHIGGQSRSMIAELDLRTGLATNWNPSAQGPGTPYPYVLSLLIHGDRLYVGGSFSSIGGQARHGLAGFDLASGELSDWDPAAFATPTLPEIYVMRGDARSIYVGGRFQSIGGQPRNYLAELDPTTGTATDWNPDPSSIVYAMAISGNTVLVGGVFRSFHMLTRHNLAAFDLKTGEVTDWNPDPDGVIIYSLVANRGKIYVGGHFSQIGGQPRSSLAALDAQTGLATAWSPDADQVVRAILVRGDTVYAGGAFSRIGGQPRHYLAAVDAVTGMATDWNPDPDDGVLALAMRGDTLYAGGTFVRMGGQTHRSLAAVDARSGAVLPWRLDTSGFIFGLAIGRNTVYAAGGFDLVNGMSQPNMLAFDATNGTLRDWAPSPNGPREDYYAATAYAIATRGDTVFVGGDFTTIGGERRASLAALDGVSGAVLDWDPNPDQSVHALEVSGDRLYAGGYFQAVAGFPHLALMGATFPGAVQPPPPALDSLPPGPFVALAPIHPNPVGAYATIRYQLPAATPVSLGVYDLQGRQVERLIEHEVQIAGEHQVRVDASQLATGCYFYRLEAGGVVRTQKAVVVR
jgi:Secretion system C-terminal sorting domain/PQQ-like domain/Domain of unknown function (DUF5122) beta-propeller